jgi:hypothetical protein
MPRLLNGFGRPGGRVNLYEYAGSNPIDSRDPSGLDTCRPDAPAGWQSVEMAEGSSPKGPIGGTQNTTIQGSTPGAGLSCAT